MSLDPLSSVFFISIPENFIRSIGQFNVDPGILLPVELKPGEKELDMRSISWEMIVSGMLRVLTYDQEHEHIDYYRRFTLAVKPDIEAELVAAGIEKARQESYDMAEEMFRTAQGINPASVAAPYNRALVYETRARSYRQLEKPDLTTEYMEKAAHAYREALQSAPDAPQVIQSAAGFYLTAGEHAAALLLFKRLNEIEPSAKTSDIISDLETQQRLDSRFQEAYTAIREGNEETALELIDNFLAESDSVWTAWFLRGWAERRRGNYEKAEADFRSALELSDPQPDILNELAICTMENGKFEESRSFLEMALKLEPNNLKILSNLGILALKEDKPEEAIARFEEVLRLDSEDPIARNYLNYLSQ